MLPYFRSMEAFFNLTIPTGWQSLSDRQLLYFFRQLMTMLILEKTKQEQHNIYLDPRIFFQEIDQYFFTGCACAFFQIAVDTYTDLPTEIIISTDNDSVDITKECDGDPDFTTRLYPYKNTATHAPSSTPPTSSTTPSTAPSTNPLTHVIHPHFHIKKNSRIPRTHRLEALETQRRNPVLASLPLSQIRLLQRHKTKEAGWTLNKSGSFAMRV